MKEAFEDYQKVKEVLKSCNNEDQLKVGVKMVNLLDRKHGKEIPTQYWDTLENIVGLMRLKCGVENIEEEISNSGEKFRVQSALSGESELQKLRFDEDEIPGGIGDDITPEDIAAEYDFPIEEIKKEIYIGTQIEKEHTNDEKIAEEFAIDHILKFIEESGQYDYYTDPIYGIVSIENSMGEGRKTLRISKDDMNKLHDEGNISLDGINLMYNEVEESTGSGSAGAYVGALSSPITRTFAKGEIPVSVNGLDAPIGKLFSFGKVKEEILEEDELEEATTTADVGGVYDTPGFPASEFMGTAGKKGKAPVNKGITHKKLAYPGGDFVKIKSRCARYPYCNQSPEAIRLSKKPFKDAFYENKIIKKGKLKIKK